MIVSKCMVYPRVINQRQQKKGRYFDNNNNLNNNNANKNDDRNNNKENNNDDDVDYDVDNNNNNKSDYANNNDKNNNDNTNKNDIKEIKVTIIIIITTNRRDGTFLAGFSARFHVLGGNGAGDQERSGNFIHIHEDIRPTHNASYRLHNIQITPYKE